MRLTDLFDFSIIALAGVVTFGIVGQSVGLMPSTKEAFASAEMRGQNIASISMAEETPMVPVQPMSHPTRKSETATRVFDAMRRGFGFDAS